MTKASTLFIQARPWKLSLGTVLVVSAAGAVLSGHSIAGWVHVESHNDTIVPVALQLFPACAVTWMLWSPMSDVEHMGPRRMVLYRTTAAAAIFLLALLGTMPLLGQSMETWLVTCRALFLYTGMALVGAHFGSGNLGWFLPVLHCLLMVVASRGYETAYSWSVVNLPASDLLSWTWVGLSLAFGLVTCYFRRNYRPEPNTK